MNDDGAIQDKKPMKAIMLQGTGSDVGKSLLVAGLCRAFSNRGLRVAPFKPQNMSNNAAVTADGGEIGRAQALQARAARVAPSIHMNPVLLKPQSETGAQVVVHGRVAGASQARDFQAVKPRLLAAVLKSFRTLSRDADIVVVEGAGSAAEINLRAGDIANMGFARAAGVPVLLVGDIERGGVIASLVGTRHVIAPDDAAMIAGFIVNKFRGDPGLFSDGLSEIERRTGWPSFGLVPYFAAAERLPAEDTLALSARKPASSDRRVEIAVLAYPFISNFDDLDPLRLEPGIDVAFIRPGTPVPATAALVILPGSKATRSDLAALRAAGWDVDLAAHVRRGGRVLGLCGGYQMLGRYVSDPNGSEGEPGTTAGLGLLDVETVLDGAKTLVEVSGTALRPEAPFRGYEMHIGRTVGPDCATPMLRFADGRTDGAVSPSGRVSGCYVHGLFSDDTLRASILETLGAETAGLSYEADLESVLDDLADHVERHLDCDRILATARSPQLQNEGV
jgi:adenosylcobyric acid synthase